MPTPTRFLILSLIGVFAVQLLVGCSAQPRDVSKQDVAVPKSNAAADDGASSGGGGYVSENSQILIDRVRLELSKQIRGASPQIFKNMPSQLTQNQLADVIENVRLSPLGNKDRDEKQLMFNYGTDAKGPYIEALQPFFTAYGNLPVKFMKDWDLRKTYRDLRLKLIHEAGHLLSLNEQSAEKFALALINSLKGNKVHCVSEQLMDFPTNHETAAAKKLEFVIYRGYGSVIQLVDDQVALNPQISKEGKQWFDINAKICLEDANENIPSADEHWFLQEEVTKWSLLKNDSAGISYEMKNPALWEGLDSISLVALSDENFSAEYKYQAKNLRSESKVANSPSLPTEGRVQLKCTQKYEILKFE